MFRKLANNLLGDRKFPTQPSGFDTPHEILPAPPQAYIPGLSKTGETDVPAKDRQSLGLMTIEVEVYRQGKVHSAIVEIPRIHISAIRRPGYEDQTYSPRAYSFEEFLRVFDRRLDENPEREPTEMKYGKVGYFTNRGDHKEVGNQKTFEKAIDHLYVHRGGSDVLKFIFQPEHYEKMVARHAAEQVILDKIAAERAIEEKKEAEKEAQRLMKELADEVAASEAAEALLINKSPKASPKQEEYVEPTESAVQSVTEPEPEIPTKVPSPVLPAKKIAARVTKAAKPETKEEQHERLLGLFKEEGRKSFKKGGDEPGQHTIAKSFIQQDDDEIDVEKVQEEEDDGISQEDRIAARLQNLLNLKALVQLRGPDDKKGTFPRWEECCRMFRIDPTATELDQKITVAGLKTSIYQYQAHGVYWQMVNSRTLGGGFVADEMGLGKTLSYLAYIVVERQLAVLCRELKKSRDAKDGKHLPAHADVNAVCPQQKAGWIACPCTPGSPTATMQPQPGLRMACVPPALVSGWWAQWKTHIDTADQSLAMKIVIDHPAAFNDRSTMEDLKCSGNQAVTQSRIKADTFRKDGKGFDQPKEYQDGWLLVTTKENFPKFAQHFKTKGQVQDPKKPGEWKAGSRIALVFGIAMIDEAHEEAFKGKGRAAILANLPTSNSNVTPFIWGYTGTPVSQTPRGMEGVLWAIEKHSKIDWTADPVLVQFESKQLDAICRRYDAQMKSSKRDDATVAKILADFEPFMTNFIIRRTSSTAWFGHTLIRLKTHIHQDIRLKVDEETTAAIAAYEAEFEGDRLAMLLKLQENWDNFPELRRSDIRPTLLWFNTMVRETWRSRLLADFPGLLKLAKSEKEENRLSLDEDEVINFFRAADQRQNATPYGRFLKHIVETSPKCLWLYKFITELNMQKDVEGKEEKLVILTAFPQVVFILRLFIQRYFPEHKDRVGVITQRMKASERQLIIDCFLDAKDEKNNPKYKREVTFLIGTTFAIGKGLGLIRARNVVLMEPDNFTTESQAYGRVDRIGQRNPVSGSYRLIDVGSEIEQKIIQRQINRNESYGRAVDAVEEVQPELVGLGISM